ncbi:MAG: hypothetical protein EOP51_18765, partial [Sphingobacteriales bacterium]
MSIPFLRGLLKFALVLTLLLNVRNVSAQTTLAAGDLLFTAFDAQPFTTATEAPFDRVSFVALKKIDPSTVIYFSDMGYKGGEWFAANNNTEGVVKLTVGETIELGEEVLLILTPGKYAATLAGTSIGVLEAAPDPRLSMGNIGDQLFAFQSDNGKPNGPGAVLITGMHWNVVQTSSGGNYTLITNDAGWDNLTAALSPSNSDLPPSLTAGHNAFYLGSIIAGNGNNDYVTAAAFNGANKPYANAAAIRTAVMNRNNWSRKTGATAGTYTIPTGHFTAIVTSPTVTSVNASTANGTYKIGDAVSIQLNFSAAVTVTGTPQLTLETGATDRVANYTSGSGTSSLTFTYTIQSGDISADLDYTSTTALALNGGTIKDGSGSNAILTLFSPGTAGSLASNKSIVIDGVAPTVAINSTANSTTSTSPIPITVTFSENVTGFVLGDITITNGTPSAFSGSGANYTFNVSPTASGAVTVNVPANVAVDAAGNGNTAASQLSRTYTPAVVSSIKRLLPSPAALQAVTFEVIFSTSVSGVTVSNFSVNISGLSTASVSSVVGSGTTYKVTVNTGTGNGTLRLNVANSTGITPTITNTPYAAGETYTITKSFTAAPELTIVGTGGTGSDVTAFVDAVQVFNGNTAFANGLQNGSFEQHEPLSNGDFGYQPTAANWTFNSRAGIAESGSAFTPTTPVPNGISVALIQSTGSTHGQISQRLALPTGSDYKIIFQASQRICCTTLDQSLNVFLEGVFLGNIQPSPDNYSQFTSAIFAVAAPALTAIVSSTATGPTTTSPIPLKVTFSQAVTGFTASDITVGNGTLNNFAGSGADYTFNIVPTANGAVTADIAANVAVDANNTGNTAVSQFSITYNQPVTAAPTITLPLNNTFTNNGSLTISGKAPANSTVSFLFTRDNQAQSSGSPVTADANGNYSLGVNFSPGVFTVSAAAQSTGEAISVRSSTITFTIDVTKPTVSITSTAGVSGSSTGTSPIPITVTFSEAVTGFAAEDIVVANGTISALSGSGSTYTFNVTPAVAGTATTVSIG